MAKFLTFVLLLTLSAISAHAGSTLVVPGTGDSQDLLRQMAGEFQALHPDVTVEIPGSIGSSGGIKAVLRGDQPLARVARPLKQDELDQGLHYRVFAWSPVVFAAHLPEACLSGVSTEEILAIYSGSIRNWAGLGSCEDAPIYVGNREEGDSSRSVLKKHLPGFSAISAPAGKTIYSTPETVNILERFTHTVVYVPLSALRHSEIPPLALNGISPTAEHVLDGRYPLVTPLAVVWKEELSGAARTFFDYLFSPEGQRIIQSQGLVPASSLSLNETRTPVK